jgi:hypothetical protein
MHVDSFYLSSDEQASRALSLTGLALDELESIVGRFSKAHHQWPRMLKGKVIVKHDGTVEIRHHFSKKLLWTNR